MSTHPAIDPGKIMVVGTGFFATKTLLSAVELGLFTSLAEEPKPGTTIERELGLHPRATADFLDALVALGFLQRDGKSLEGTYRNADDVDLFLDRNKPTYIGGVLEMCNLRLYGFWGDLTRALRSGEPQNEVKSGQDVFGSIYADEGRLEAFLHAMSSLQMEPFTALAQKMDLSRYRTVCDAGGAGGTLSIVLARRHPHLSFTTFDLPPVEPLAERNVSAAGLADRIAVASGDFFTDPLPKADVVTMGNILHDWNLDKKLYLIRAAYDALPEGGALIAIENVIDDDRRHNVFGLLMSLNMLIETGTGFDYTGSDFTTWAEQVGFKGVEITPLTGPTSAAIAYK